MEAEGTPESGFLLQLAELARSTAASEYKQRALRALQRTLVFDSAIWIEARPQDGYIYEHSRMLYNQPDCMMDNYHARVTRCDILAHAAMDSPGITIDIDNLCPRDELLRHPVYTDHMRHYHMAHCLSTAYPHPGTRVFSFISLYRAREGDRYSETERQKVQALIPFLVDGYKTAQFLALTNAHHAGPNGHSPMAIVDTHGVVYQQTNSWQSSIEQLVPNWNGAELPACLTEQLDNGQYILMDCVCIHIQPIGRGLLFLQAQTPKMIQSLTRTECIVAERYASGSNRREIAQQLGRSPDTIKIHLNRVYKKLQVNSKLELADALRRLEMLSGEG